LLLGIFPLTFRDVMAYHYTMTEKKLAAKIRRVRLQRGLTESEAGRALGISKQAWHQWETSERSPRIASLIKISQVLGCTAAALLCEDDRAEEGENAPDRSV
jgi:transcriptional regulator with XRE-family HTH domain